MKRTLGEPGLARIGRGHAGVDSSTVRPRTPGNAEPRSYSLSGIAVLFRLHVGAQHLRSVTRDAARQPGPKTYGLDRLRRRDVFELRKCAPCQLARERGAPRVFG